ncbi:flagellar basal-body MS-ring/collar protein FliF [Gallaecimonas kandeliae]|uniref:flagellar basal-body MS-ring/collar protein FliF n=1 Tax=Gallaecimonas kandeliae TaxID=3029055 RepID=UPI0026484334|nr:flagellar basal-body MS-ring/collar protein FliF [Gallaecimonas kandeliae]WKE66521.1 flagellar basal-body MS-ring/collar protein FliF [Gallaecimonas kandeliae]
MAELINAQPASPLLDNLKSLGSRWRRLSGDSRSVLVIALLAALVASAIVVILWTSSRQYVPLYGKQEAYDKASILDNLEKDGIDFRLDAATGNVLVPQDKLADARMRLAAHGIKAALPAGLDDLGNISSLGTSQFMESARYLHALEGELARTIMALDSVRSARVHLAVPKRTLFVGREEQKPSAAILVDLASPLDRGQVEAILNLVAGAIPGMKASAVSVVDQEGQLLSADLEEAANSGRLTDKQMDYGSRLEERMAQRARDMLSPLLGQDNFRVQVAANLDFSAVEETREALDDKPVMVSETAKRDNSTDNIALGIPGALTNRPPVAQNNSATAANSNTNTAEDPQKAVSQREETSRRFETGKAVTHTQYAQGRLKQLSVSVLLNSAKAPKGGWSQAELDQLSDMVKNAVGFDAQRGDQFSLHAFSFAPAAPALAELPQPQWWQDPMWRDYLRYGLGAFMLLLLILFGIRPLVKHLVRPLPAGDEELDYLQEEQAPAPVQALEGSGEEALLAALPPPGSELEVQLKHLQLLVDKETARVAEVVKQWVSNDERHD